MKRILAFVGLVALALAAIALLPLHGMLEHLLQGVSFLGAAGVTSFPTGDQAKHYVSEDWDGLVGGIAAATWTPLDGLGEYRRSNNANATDNFMYGRSQAVSTVGKPARSVTLSGWHAVDDAGQDLLREYSQDGAEAGEQLGYAYLRDGTKGWAAMVTVGGGEESSNAQGGLQTVSFTLAPQTDPVTVTTGIP